jgi:formamidopyrimidine-DNA glycosylase
VPELPEAETIVGGLRGPLVGRAVTSVQVIRPDLLDGSPRQFSEAVTDRTIGGVSRRGKNVVLRIEGAGSSATDPAFLVVNLGMSGRLLHRPAGDRSPPPSHPGVRFKLDDRSQLVYDDVRRFGRLRLMASLAFGAWSRTLGPEPLSPHFTVAGLIGELGRSRTQIRGWLLDQRRVAGVGNIYANEALFRAHVHPRRPANELSSDEARRLHKAIRSILRAAVAANGTTLRDYRTAQGGHGSYASQLRVYAREGSGCIRCEDEIQRTTFGGRSAFFCPTCQPSAEIGA